MNGCARMDFKFSAEDEAFRHEVRSFMQANLPQDIAQDVSRWVNRASSVMSGDWLSCTE